MFHKTFTSAKMWSQHPAVVLMSWRDLNSEPAAVWARCLMSVSLQREQQSDRNPADETQMFYQVEKHSLVLTYVFLNRTLFFCCSVKTLFVIVHFFSWNTWSHCVLAPMEENVMLSCCWKVLWAADLMKCQTLQMKSAELPSSLLWNIRLSLCCGLMKLNDIIAFYPSDVKNQ